MSPQSSNGLTARTASTDQLRLITKVARLYHEQGVNQPQIARQLSISQARVSRLLKQATELGIVRTTVVPPAGVYTDIEAELQQRYGLLDVVVVEAEEEPAAGLLTALGSAAAAYLDVTLTGGDLIGLSSWSATLLATVDAMRPKPSPVAQQVVQIVGGVGNSSVQFQATRLTSHLADLTRANPVFMPAPGLVGSPLARAALVEDETVREVMALWPDLTLLLLGIGSLEPSPLLRRSGNAIAEADQAELRKQGAVGDVCLRFFDIEGQLVPSQLDDRVLGITPEQVRHVDRRIGVAGGMRKAAAIRAALVGGWINILVTDLAVARRLLDERPADESMT